MAASTARLNRLLRMVTAIGSSRSGLRTEAIADRIGVSRATVDRDLALLRGAGFPLERVSKVGEVRHRLVAGAFEGVSRETMLALTLARATLEPLRGTSHVAALDRAIQGVLDASASASVAVIARRSGSESRWIAALERAIAERRRLRCRIWTTSSGDAPGDYTIEPARLLVIDRDVYVQAVKLDDGTQAWRKFKLVRFESVEDIGPATTDLVASRPPAITGRSVKLWSECARRVVVRFDASVARVCREFPIADAAVYEPHPQGGLICTVDVEGLVEIRPRLLGWGSRVEVLGPAELREWTANELRRAASLYSDDGSASSPLTDRERSLAAAPSIPQPVVGMDRRRGGGGV